MTTYCDDNYGQYEIEGPDDIEFYQDVQRRSVRKRCHGCGRMVRILPDYAYCDSCANKREHGFDL